MSTRDRFYEVIQNPGERDSSVAEFTYYPDAEDFAEMMHNRYKSIEFEVRKI